MLKIRGEQMTAFRAAAMESFKRDVAARLRDESLPRRRSYSPAEIDALVDEGVRQSARQGFVTADQITRFAVCMLKHGPGFLRAEPWARAIEADDDLTPDQKLERLEAR